MSDGGSDRVGMIVEGLRTSVRFMLCIYYARYMDVLILSLGKC